MTHISRTDSGFVIVQGNTYWTDLFVRHFLVESEADANDTEADDILFFVRKKHVKGTSRNLPKYDVSTRNRALNTHKLFHNQPRMITTMSIQPFADRSRRLPQRLAQTAHRRSGRRLGGNRLLESHHPSVQLHPHVGHLYANVAERAASVAPTFAARLCVAESPENGHQRRRRRDDVSAHLLHGG